MPASNLPTLKKVALTLYLRSTCAIWLMYGAWLSSKVSATVLPAPGAVRVVVPARALLHGSAACAGAAATVTLVAVTAVPARRAITGTVAILARRRGRTKDWVIVVSL